jgi:hypothetical protein
MTVTRSTLGISRESPRQFCHFHEITRAVRRPTGVPRKIPAEHPKFSTAPQPAKPGILSQGIFLRSASPPSVALQSRGLATPSAATASLRWPPILFHTAPPTSAKWRATRESTLPLPIAACAAPKLPTIPDLAVPCNLRRNPLDLVAFSLQNFLGAFDAPRWPYGDGLGTFSLGTQYVARIMHAASTYQNFVMNCVLTYVRIRL